MPFYYLGQSCWTKVHFDDSMQLILSLQRLKCIVYYKILCLGCISRSLHERHCNTQVCVLNGKWRHYYGNCIKIFLLDFILFKTTSTTSCIDYCFDDENWTSNSNYMNKFLILLCFSVSVQPVTTNDDEVGLPSRSSTLWSFSMVQCSNKAGKRIQHTNAKKETTSKLNYVHILNRGERIHTPDVCMGWCGYKIYTSYTRWNDSDAR